jgi:DNA polymerase-3 subunit delta
MAGIAKEAADKSRASMNVIKQNIETGTYANVYLLFGDEVYLLDQYKKKLVDALMDGADAMNLTKVADKEFRLPEIIDIAETMPFFATRRVILAENTGLFKSGGDALAEYLERVPESTVMVFVESAVDKRSKAYKTVGKVGKCLEFTPLSQQDIKQWIGVQCKREGKQISLETAQFIIDQVGDEMQTLSKEMEKLLNFTMNKDVITKEDVEEICVMKVTSQIFKLTDAIAAGNQKAALDYYYDMLELGEAPLYILAMINRQFDLMLQVKTILLRGHADRNDVMQGMGFKSPYQADIYMRQCKAFPLEYLKKTLRDSADLEVQMKTGLMDMQMGVELFLVEHSRKVK